MKSVNVRTHGAILVAVFVSVFEAVAIARPSGNRCVSPIFFVAQIGVPIVAVVAGYDLRGPHGPAGWKCMPVKINNVRENTYTKQE